ncbi:MAG: sulfatase-like hydrolase/transferase [Clostridiales bacterium]|nr:sulfatase-like hydrolase/transferase [Clostridiales bacterium]
MKRPNLLFIMYDQQRYDCVEMSGMNPVKTPNLARIADGGVFFEKAYTPIPVCVPARNALFSGRRPEAYGGLWNPHIVFPIHGMEDDCYSWTRDIRDSGYNTAYIGLWEADSHKQPSDYGFNSYIGRSDINKLVNEKHSGIQWKNGYFGEPSPIPLEHSYTHQVARLACEKLEELHEAGQPWYLHLDNPEPHLPCRPSAPFDTMYNPDELPAWGSIGETFENKPYIQHQQLINWELENRTWENDWKYTAAMYYGIISQYDDAVGRILNKLDELGETENTIIVYVTDHGDLCGGHRLIDKHYNMYEDITHVPMAVRWDGRIKPNRFTGFVSSMLDLPPTIMGLMGLPVPNGVFQGKDLSPELLAGDSSDGREYAVSTYNGQQFGLYCERMIVGEHYKYVWNLTDIDELYDLKNDPHELTNLIRNESLAPVLSELREKLYHELERCGDPIIRWNKAQLLSGRKLTDH